MKVTGCYFYLQGLFRGAKRYGILNEMIMNKNYEKRVVDVEISKLRSITNSREYNLLLVDDIGSKPCFMLDEEFTKYTNCTAMEQITGLNRNLDIKNSFITFKEFR